MADRVPADAASTATWVQQAPFDGLSQRLRLVARRMRRSPLGMLSVALLATFVIIAILSPVITPRNPDAQFAGHELTGPSRAFVMGTDQFGRDVFSRVVDGLRLSLEISASGAVLGAILGILIGLAAGFWGGVGGAILMRLTDSLIAIPGILFALVIVSALGSNFLSLVIAIGVLTSPVMSRLANGGATGELVKDYVVAAHAIGAKPSRVLFRHIWPNVLPILIVQLAITITFGVLIEASLSFLGLGVQPPTPTIGGMISDSRAFMRVAWWYATFPAITLTLLIFSINGVADVVNDLLEHR